MQMEDAAEAIHQHFNAEWAEHTPICLGNEVHSEPGAPWVRFTLVPSTREQATIGGPGNKLFESIEFAIVQIFSPPDAGDRRLRQLQQRALDVFEGRSVSVGSETIHFFDVEPEREAEETNWLAGSVTAKCRYQERK